MVVCELVREECPTKKFGALFFLFLLGQQWAYLRSCQCLHLEAFVRHDRTCFLNSGVLYASASIDLFRFVSLFGKNVSVPQPTIHPTSLSLQHKGLFKTCVILQGAGSLLTPKTPARVSDLELFCVGVCRSGRADQHCTLHARQILIQVGEQYHVKKV